MIQISDYANLSNADLRTWARTAAKADVIDLHRHFERFPELKHSASKREVLAVCLREKILNENMERELNAEA